VAADICCVAQNFRAIIGCMSHLFINAEVLTSARMAAGMTSRARRPGMFSPAG
jgi:hypothetical protein